MARRGFMFESAFLYRCADLLYKLAEGVDKDRAHLTPEFVAKIAEGSGLRAHELRDLGEILKLLSLMMQALIVTRESTIDQLSKRIFELEKEKERGWKP